MKFNRKHLTTLVAALLLATLTHSTTAAIYDFMVGGLAYDKISSTTVKVTFQRTGFPSYANLSGDLTIPSTVTYGGNTYTVVGIYNYAFDGCNLTSITIPNTITSIGPGAFRYTNLKSVNIKDLAAWCNIDCGADNSNPLSIAHHLYINGKEITNLNIPDSITVIKNCVFYGCYSLTSITIPNTVTNIGSYAFSGCTNLININFPNSYISIGNCAFSGTPWYNNQPDGLVYAGLVAYKYKGTVHESTNIAIKNGTLGVSSYCFDDNGITGILVPNSIKYIGEHAFYDCKSLKYIVCKATTPPTITGSNAFPNIPIFIPEGTMVAYKNANYWNNFNLRYSLTKVNTYTTQVSATSEDQEISHLVKVKLNNKEYSVSNDSIMVSGLQPSEQYSAVAICKVVGEDINDTITFTTKPVRFESLTGSSTQTTITPKFKVYRDDPGFSIQSSGAKYNGKDYTGSIIQETSDYFIIETAPITGLTPNSKIYYTPWVTCNGKRCEGQQYNITTQNIGTSSNAVTGPTNVEMTASYNAGDATVKDAYFTFNGQQMKKIVMTGLRPSTTYSTVYTVVTNTGRTFNTNMSFTTKSLTMTTQEARMLSDTSPMLIAETNMADVETSCGFEWRRYDAPEEMPSAKVYCPVYGGTMAGVLKNMSPNVYYKYRPFYKASDGSEYYGNWIAFITADAGVTFEPVVYTYKAPEVTQNTATLQGVALPGSSEITEQGFEYWRMNGSKAPTGTVNKVTATGQRMSATVQGLNAGATYGYRSYVKAGGQTYYGSEEQFTTEKPTGDVNGDSAVNVSDVTTLVNMILGVIPKDNTRADIDGNGTVNVSDVTALVRLILNV